MALFSSPAIHSVLTRIDFGQPLYAGEARLQAAFTTPLRVLEARTAAEVAELLAAVEAAARAGYWCVGGLRYEAAQAFDSGLPVPGTPDSGSEQPLAWFAIHAAPLSHCTQSAPLAAELDWQGEMNAEAFQTALGRIHADIGEGRYYQLNLTQRYRARSTAPLDVDALFAALQQAQPGGYALQFDMGSSQILSVSPELFFDWHQPAAGDGQILTRPMKGTAARGSTPAADQAAAAHLRTSVKERAENLMIVDLLRNDLGRIARTGSVQVDALFATQALPTVWQMTSDVRAQLPAATRLHQVLAALFPCGSVTGAPKRSAMAAIAALETSARGWYCGALGVVRSDGAGGMRASFNVPIRTIVIDHVSNGSDGSRLLSCGIGSGITFDANATDEWQEWRNKRRFFERVSQPFTVLETFALDQGQPRHAALHLARMASAAAHFGYPCALENARALIAQCAAQHPQGQWRLRLQLHADGGFELDCQPLPANPAKVTLQWASTAIDSSSEYVRFKTSRRAHYERHAPRTEGVFDTVLWNAAGEITECTRGNIAARIDGRWLTPALTCGLLPGIGRQLAVAEGRISEAILRLEDLPRIEAWAFLNSLRGWIPAEIATRSRPEG